MFFLFHHQHFYIDEVQTAGTNGQPEGQGQRTDDGSTGSAPGDASHVVMIPEDEKDGQDAKGKKDKKKKKDAKEGEGDDKTKKKVRIHDYGLLELLFYADEVNIMKICL